MNIAREGKATQKDTFKEKDGTESGLPENAIDGKKEGIK
jgi:hypothetical protein